MEALRNALLSELATRAISFLISTYGSRLMPAAATVREREEEEQEESRLMHRLWLLLLRIATIVEEAEGRRVTNRGMLRQLRALGDAMVRGHYALDTVRYEYDTGGGGRRRRQDQDGSSKDKEGSPASAPSRSKRARWESSSSSETSLRRRRMASSLQLQQMVRSLEAIIADAKELVVLLTCCPPVSCRQPYSAHLFLDKCMLNRHEERDQVLEFLLQVESLDTAAASPGVLPIVGPALIGKSTLVEHVCNDERVRSHFSLILLHASSAAAGDAGLVGGGAGGHETMATTTLRDSCVTKHQSQSDKEDERWLLVVEISGDVDDEAWNSFLCSYSRGTGAGRCTPMPRGSKVILTSRSEKIERLGTASRAVRLRCIGAEAMWYFFKLSAFGSADPDEHPGLASVAMDMAAEARGSFVAANVMAAMVRGAHFGNQQHWCRVLATARRYMRKNLVLFGEYPDDLKAKDRPRRTWSMNKLLKRNECFLMYETYQKRFSPGQTQTQTQQEEVAVLPDPEVTVMDMLSGRAQQPRGRKFEILLWKSVLPPYFSYICPCEIRDT